MFGGLLGNLRKCRDLKGTLVVMYIFRVEHRLEIKTFESLGNTRVSRDVD